MHRVPEYVYLKVTDIVSFTCCLEGQFAILPNEKYVKFIYVKIHRDTVDLGVSKSHATCGIVNPFLNYFRHTRSWVFASNFGIGPHFSKFSDNSFFSHFFGTIILLDFATILTWILKYIKRFLMQSRCFLNNGPFSDIFL